MSLESSERSRVIGPASPRVERPRATPPGVVRRSFLESNLDSLQLGPATRRAVRRTEPGPAVRLRLDGSPVVWDGQRMLGEPVSHAELLSQLGSVDEDTVVLVFGLGVGQVARTLRTMCRAPVIVVEPDVALLRSVLEYGPLGLGDVPIVSGLAELSWVWRHFRGRAVAVRLVSSAGYREAYARQLAEVAAEIPTLQQQTAISRATYRGRAQTWVKDILANLPLVATSPPFLCLQRGFEGVPAFIVGAGPSLDKNVERLREAARKGIVLATNSGALALAARGIEPQVIVCIESIDASRKLEQVPFIDRAVRAFSLSAAPEALRVGAGPLLPFHEAIPQYDGPLQLLTGAAGVLTSGSVSTAAFSLARIMGCSPITLVGQDLAYTDGATYACGTGYESSKAHVRAAEGVVEIDWNSEILRVHGTEQGRQGGRESLRMQLAWGGATQVVSTAGFSAVQQWFAGFADLLSRVEDPPRLVNATEGGARIEGFEELPLQALLDQLPVREITPAQIAERAHARWQPPTRRKVLDWLHQQARMARRVAAQARRCRRLSSYARGAIERGRSDAIPPAFARLELAERDLRHAVRECPLVDAWSHSLVERAVTRSRRRTEDAEDAALHAMTRSVRVARAVERSAKALTLAIEQTVEGFTNSPPPSGVSQEGSRRIG